MVCILGLEKLEEVQIQNADRANTSACRVAPSVAVGNIVQLVSNKTVAVYGDLGSLGSLEQEQGITFGEMKYQHWQTGPKARRRVVDYQNKSKNEKSVRAVLLMGLRIFFPLPSWEVLIFLLAEKTIKAVPIRLLNDIDGNQNCNDEIWAEAQLLLPAFLKSYCAQLISKGPPPPFQSKGDAGRATRGSTKVALAASTAASEGSSKVKGPGKKNSRENQPARASEEESESEASESRGGPTMADQASLKRVQKLELKLAAMQELDRKQGLKLATVLAEQAASKRAQEAASKELPHRSKGKAPPNAHSKRKQTAPEPDESDEGSESSGPVSPVPNRNKIRKAWAMEHARAKQISSDLLEERRRREQLEQQNKVLAAQLRARQMLACEAAALGNF